MSVVKKLINEKANVSLKNTSGKTALIAARKGGHLRVMNELMKAGDDLNLQDNERNTLLDHALNEGHVSVVEELVKPNVDDNLNNEWRVTPLIAASKGGHARVVEELVKEEADVNLQDSLGNTPLIPACYGGHISVVKKLLRAKADVNRQNKLGNTPLIAACKGGHVVVVEELVKVEADVNLQDRLWHTPLISACEGGHVKVVNELVKTGADINLRDGLDNTPLIAAVRECPLSTVKYLVEHGAEFSTHVVDIDVSAVYRALVLNKRDIVKYLIQVQNETNPGQFDGHVHLFNCLVDIRHAGVKRDSGDDVVVTDRSVWCMDEFGYLWGAMKEGDCNLLRHLVYVGLDVNQSIQLNNSDARPLLYTLIDELYFNHRSEVGVLLGAGVNVNDRVRYREYDSAIDREGVSILERTRRLVCKYSEGKFSKDIVQKYKQVMCEIKKHVRRYSV